MQNRIHLGPDRAGSVEKFISMIPETLAYLKNTEPWDFTLVLFLKSFHLGMVMISVV